MSTPSRHPRQITRRFFIVLLTIVTVIALGLLLVVLSWTLGDQNQTSSTATAQARATATAIAETTVIAKQTVDAGLIAAALVARAATATAMAVEAMAAAETATAEALAATPTVLPSPVAIDEEASSIRLGEMVVERPVAMIQGASGSWLVEMYIPEQYASLEPPTDIEFIKVGPAEPPVEGALYATDFVTLWLSQYMQVELRVPAGFTLDGPPAVWKEINLEAPYPYVVWEWLLTAPDQPGTHEILLNVYQAKVAPNASEGAPVDERERAIPPRRYQLKVVAYTPTPTATFTPTSTTTPTPTITPTPTPVPFFDRPGTTAGIGALATIIAALIGLIGIYIARDRIPPLTKGQKRRALEKQIAKKTRRQDLLKEQQARHGINTDPAIVTEIEDLEAEIEKLKQDLEALD